MTIVDAPRFVLTDWRTHERAVRLRLPFRFGVVTMTEAPQLFVDVGIRFANGRTARGMSASILAPKWFDKRTELTNDDNFDQLRRAVGLAGRAYRDTGGARTAFAHFENAYHPVLDAAAAEDLGPLVAGFGPAMFDAAILDAVGRATGQSMQTLVRANAIGIGHSALCPDLADFDLPGFLAGLEPVSRIAVRHTVGLLDALGDDAEPGADGLPVSLAGSIRRYGLHHFKVKVGGDHDADLRRLGRIAATLDA